MKKVKALFVVVYSESMLRISSAASNFTDFLLKAVEASTVGAFVTDVMSKEPPPCPKLFALAILASWASAKREKS